MKIDKITVHCSATKEGVDITADMIRGWHKAHGWSDIGYHYVIRLDGTLESGRPMSKMGAHVRGHNQNNLGICLIGGLDKNGNAKDTFTDAQYSTLRFLITKLIGSEGVKQENIKGHRDYSPDLNGDGKITSNEFIKQCPCFDVQSKLKEWM